MAKKPILTLDIGSHSLKLAEFAEVKGSLEMTRYAVADLGLSPDSDADRSQFIITTIHELLSESGAKPGPVQISIAGNSVFSRFVKLPPVEPEKVYQIIQYEAQQNVPFPINEVVWDYQLISGAGGDVDVMLAAIKTDVIEGIVDCVKFAGLMPERVDMAPMALYNSVRYNYTNLPECTLVVDMGARSTDLIFIEAGRVFSRSVPVAGNNVSQLIMNEFNISFDAAEDMKKAHAYVAFGGPYEGPQSETVDKVSKCVRSTMTRLHQELNRSINFYRSQQGGQQPSLILLTGGSSVIPYTDTFLREKLRVETDYFNPFNNVAVAERIPADRVGNHACELGPVVGLALRQLHTCPIEINLIPRKAEEEKAFDAKKPLFAAAAATLLVILGVWIGFYAHMASTAVSQAEQVQDRVQKLTNIERVLTAEEQNVEGISKQVNRLLDVNLRRGVWRAIFSEIASVVPDGMWLSRIRPVFSAPPEGADDPAMVLTAVEVEGSGYLDKHGSAEAITQFRDALRGLDIFSEEKTETTWQPPVRSDASMLEFRILVVLKEPKAL